MESSFWVLLCFRPHPVRLKCQRRVFRCPWCDQELSTRRRHHICGMRVHSGSESFGELLEREGGEELALSSSRSWCWQLPWNWLDNFHMNYLANLKCRRRNQC